MMRFEDRWSFRSWLLAAVLAAVPVTSVRAQRVFHTVEEALAMAFPGARVERSTEVLSEAECAQVARDSGVAAPGRMVFPYFARLDREPVGVAYFDLHRVRTLRETVMVVVGLDGKLVRVQLCAFAEPLDYVPRDVFYAQFVGRALDEDLRLRRGIDGVTGATLTCRATTDCARRVLAVHALLEARRARERVEQQEEQQEEKEREKGGRVEPGDGGPPPERPPPAPRGRTSGRADEGGS
jgi:hypothetical protein